MNIELKFILEYPDDNEANYYFLVDGKAVGVHEVDGRLHKVSYVGNGFMRYSDDMLRELIYKWNPYCPEIQDPTLEDQERAKKYINDICEFCVNNNLY